MRIFVKKFVLPLLSGILILTACSKKEGQKNLVLPIPTEVDTSGDLVKLTGQIQVHLSPNFPEEKKGKVQKELISSTLELVGNASYEISFVFNEDMNDEHYKLDVAKDGILVQAGSDAGFYYGLQTLKQLLVLHSEDGYVPIVRIEDGPNYTWRGMHLDVSRHFISKEYLLPFIELMASYKLNKLHLHLTDDQGWRLQIDKYPKLTEEGAWRTLDNKQDQKCMELAKENNDPDYLLPDKHLKVVAGDTLYGGYYTKDDMREIVSFAKDRHVEIIPEIDMPGHILSAIENYPELACVDNPGWNQFSAPLCAGNEKVYEFVENVLTEVFELFPSKYVHIGADEVEKINWEKCPKCQKRIEENQLKDEHDLQSYFVQRVNEMLKKKGKTMIAWDEVLSGDMPENTVMMHWRNWNVGAAEKSAALNNKYVVALDHQVYLPKELNVVYNLNPMDPNLPKDKQHLLLGVQTCSWGETKASENLVSRANIPSLHAIAEVGWSIPENKNWDDFIFRLEKHLESGLASNFKYSQDFNEEFWSKTIPNDDGSILLELHSGTSGAKIEVENELSETKIYNAPLRISENKNLLATMTLSDTIISMPLNFSFNKATGRKLQAEIIPPHSYGNVTTLVDGLKGRDNFDRKRWIAYLDKYFIGTIDLGGLTDVSEIKIGLLDQNIKDDLPLPTFSVTLSEDGKNFFIPDSLIWKYNKRDGLGHALDAVCQIPTTSAKCVKIVCHEYAPGGTENDNGTYSFVFMDEIQIN